MIVARSARDLFTRTGDSFGPFSPFLASMVFRQSSISASWKPRSVSRREPNMGTRWVSSRDFWFK